MMSPRRNLTALFRTLFGVLVGWVWLALSSGLDCSCPMDHSAGKCCCEEGDISSDPVGECAGKHIITSAAPALPEVVVAALEIAAPQAPLPSLWPDLLRRALPGREMDLAERARPPPERPAWIRYRSLLI